MIVMTLSVRFIGNNISNVQKSIDCYSLFSLFYVATNKT